MQWKCMVLTLALASGCSVTQTKKTKTWYYPNGEKCYEECEESTTVETPRGTFSGKATIMGQTLEFEADTGEKIECEAQTPEAMQELIDKLEGCTCGEGGGDGATGTGGDQLEAEILVEPGGECEGPVEDEEECTATLSEDDWECTEL